MVISASAPLMKTPEEGSQAESNILEGLPARLPTCPGHSSIAHAETTGASGLAPQAEHPQEKLQPGTTASTALHKNKNTQSKKQATGKLTCGPQNK